MNQNFESDDIGTWRLISSRSTISSAKEIGFCINGFPFLVLWIESFDSMLSFPSIQPKTHLFWSCQASSKIRTVFPLPDKTLSLSDFALFLLPSYRKLLSWQLDGIENLKELSLAGWLIPNSLVFSGILEVPEFVDRRSFMFLFFHFIFLFHAFSYHECSLVSNLHFWTHSTKRTIAHRLSISAFITVWVRLGVEADGWIAVLSIWCHWILIFLSPLCILSLAQV